MAHRHAGALASLRAALRNALAGPQVLAFLPALVLGAYWTAGEGALVVVALGVPLVVLVAGGFEPVATPGGGQRDAVTGLPTGETLEPRLDATLQAAEMRGLKTACLMMRLEGFGDFANRHGVAAGDRVLETVASRLQAALRDGDQLVRLAGHGPDGAGHAAPDCAGGSFAIALGAVPHLDLEAGIQLAARLQSAAEEPVALDGAPVYLSAAVGFCLSSRSPGTGGRGLIEGAGIALAEALRNGPSAIRAFSVEMGQNRAANLALRDDARRALDNGEITPWFQPQVSTDTGRITGFEALARWHHPERGLIPPAEFLPILQQEGQMERLGEVILYGALTAVTAWDAAGTEVPHVAVNFTGEELRNPKLADKIRWDLDRFDLTPDRLTVEVLETVVAGSPEDTATRNIVTLAEMGCRIDLDDFGTGHASIAAIRRFAIERIKIDRSFVTHVDDDTEQQRMVSAILTMAERLGVDTLAEGVETAGEHAMLAQLGCRHVQGFGIARPMPFEQTIAWVRDHDARLTPPPSIGRRSG